MLLFVIAIFVWMPFYTAFLSCVHQITKHTKQPPTSQHCQPLTLPNKLHHLTTTHRNYYNYHHWVTKALRNFVTEPLLKRLKMQIKKPLLKRLNLGNKKA